MGSSGRHIIRKTYLEVDGGGQADPFRFQQDAVLWAQGRLLAELEEVFAGLPESEAHILYDRLEITVDASDPDHWGTEIMPKLKAELSAALRKGIQAAGLAKGPESLGAARSFFRKLAHYLEHGVLPWNLAAATRSEFESEVEEWLRSPAVPEQAPELSALLATPSVRARLLQSLPSVLVVQILIRLYSMPEPLAKAWAADASLLSASFAQPRISHPAARPASSHGMPHALLEEILSALAHNPRLFAQALEEEIIQGYLVRVLRVDGLPPESLKVIRFASSAFILSKERILRSHSISDAIASIPEGQARADVDILPNPLDVQPPSDPAPAGPLGSHLESAPAAASELPRTQGENASAPALEGIFIRNAGLVLLAPFLSMLFERLGLSRGAEMKDPATALLLQHYLVTGETDPAEFELALPKVLCDWPIEKTIPPPAAGLSGEMQEEAGQLLESVIGHWGVLKGTSVGGLRESFLQRPGKLSQNKKGDWLLQVEQKAFDMLLQQLPWSFNLIRMPWMKTVLRTEWVE